MLEGTFTDLRKNKYADINKNGIGASLLDLSFFRVGEGGWILVGGIRIPKTPDSSYTDLEASTNPNEFMFQKALNVVADVVVVNNIATVTCTLSAIEAGLDGQGLLAGADPHLYEMGLFDIDGNILVYATFDEIIKTAGNPNTFILNLGYAV